MDLIAINTEKIGNNSPNVEHSNGTGNLFVAIMVQVQLPKTLFSFWERSSQFSG